MKRMVTDFCKPGIYTLLGLAVAAPVLGQTEAATGQNSSRPRVQDRPVLEETVVTAQRIEQNIQDVPISIVSVDSQQLADSGVDNLQELSILVPGLQVSQGAATANTYIRGVGSQALGPGLESPVALYVDGVYYASAFGSPAEFSNVERVEVLKGPQGTLFGRNATGGLVQIITKTPDQAPSVEMKASYGNYDYLNFDFYGTTGIGESLAADLSAVVGQQGDGYGTNFLSGEDVNRVDHNIQLRSKWLWTPTQDTNVTAAIDYGDIDSSMNSNRILPGTSVPFLIGPTYGGNPWDTEVNTEPSIKTKSGGASVKLEHDLGFAQLVNILAYRKAETNASLDLDATATVFTAVYPLEQNEDQWTEELQLQSLGDSALSWIAGVYFFYDDAKIDEPLHFGPLLTSIRGYDGLRYDGRQESTSYAGYGQATYEFLPDTNLTLGGRYTYEKRDFRASQFAVDGTTETPLIDDYTDSETYSKPTYRVALDHRFSPEVLGYVAVNTGYKSGGYNALAPTQPPFDPEELNAYSAGLKSELFDNRLRVNVEAFYYEYDEIQLGVVLALGSGVTAPGIINGGKADVYGFEMDMQAAITSDLTISGGFSYLDSEFVESADNFAIGSPEGNVPTYLDSVKGNTLPYSPDFVGSLAANYGFDIAKGRANWNVTYQYNTGYYTEPDNVIEQSSYSWLNASLGWTSPEQRYSVSVWGKNLTDEEVITNELTLAFGPHESVYLPPLTYGITVGVAF